MNADGAIPLTALDLSRPLERSIEKGEVHSYLIELAAGQLLRLNFDRRGAPILVSAHDPKGRELGRFGRSIDLDGELEAALVARVPGLHRIEVSTARRLSSPGRYVLLMEDLRVATPEDWMGICHAEGRSAEQLAASLASIATCLEAVGAKLAPTHSDADRIARTAVAEVDFLKSLWVWGVEVSAAYRESLAAALEGLLEALAEPDVEAAFELLRAVAEDLAVKAKHCRNGGMLDVDVLVEVTTIKRGRDDSGWYVYYKPGLYRNKREYDPRRFPQRTDPTAIKQLPAGAWILWAEKHDVVSRPEEMRVHFDGDESFEWDHEVP